MGRFGKAWEGSGRFGALRGHETIIFLVSGELRGHKTVMFLVFGALQGHENVIQRGFAQPAAVLGGFQEAFRKAQSSLSELGFDAFRGPLGAFWGLPGGFPAKMVPKRPPEAPKRRPRGPREAPKRPPRGPQEAPRGAQEGPKIGSKIDAFFDRFLNSILVRFGVASGVQNGS